MTMQFATGFGARAAFLPGFDFPCRQVTLAPTSIATFASGSAPDRCKRIPLCDQHPLRGAPMLNSAQRELPKQSTQPCVQRGIDLRPGALGLSGPSSCIPITSPNNRLCPMPCQDQRIPFGIVRRAPASQRRSCFKWGGRMRPCHQSAAKLAPR